MHYPDLGSASADHAVREISFNQCVIPENIHTSCTDGQLKFLRGGGAKG